MRKEPTADYNRRQRFLAVVVGLIVLFGAVVAYNSSSTPSEGISDEDLRTQVRELTVKLEQFEREQTSPGVVSSRYRNSIGYICGVYQVGFRHQRPEIRMRVSGTGFLVGNGLVATNRHVAEPWYEDSEAKSLIDRGATATLESLVVFFPGSAKSVRLLHGSVSRTSDLAVLRTEDSDVIRGLTVVPLASSPGPPGQPVMVMGYPLGVVGMAAKSTSDVYERLAYRHNDIDTASKLAAKSLICPFTTYGHLGDIVGDKIIYDATSAHGGSGGPVLNFKGEVIGVNSAYIDGFSGGTFGVSVESLRPLVDEVLALVNRGIPDQIQTHDVH